VGEEEFVDPVDVRYAIIDPLIEEGKSFLKVFYIAS